MTTVLIAIAPEVIEKLFTRDHLGNRLRVDWGEREADGFHSPTITVDYADNLVAAERARIAEAVRGLAQPEHDGEICLHCVERADVLAIVYPEANH